MRFTVTVDYIYKHPDITDTNNSPFVKGIPGRAQSASDHTWRGRQFKNAFCCHLCTY